MARGVTRRTFLEEAALGGAGWLVLADGRSARAYAANDRFNVAVIGCGGRGRRFVEAIPKVADLVALCDVNGKRAEEALKAHPDLPKFHDFREMLDRMDKEIDAVTVATPDHTHAQASVMAMRRGKHAYCEKGLTRTVHEARLMRKVAEEKRLATQMGNQGSSCRSARRGMELIQDGVLGEVKEVIAWAALPVVSRDEAPKGEQKIPDYLQWDLWLGYAPYRPFHSQWLGWTQWREFGNGWVGMWGSHGCFIAWNGLNMLSLWQADPAEKVRIRVEAQVSEINSLSYPRWEVVRYRIPARGAQPPCDWTWVSGAASAPGWMEKIEAAVETKSGWREKEWTKPVPHAGSVIVGSKGSLHGVASNFSFSFVDPGKFKGVDAGTPKRYPLVPGEYEGHEADWLRAARDGRYTVSDFRNSGPYTEFLMLGNVATRVEGMLEYDPVEGRITNNERANALLTCERRKGWEL